MKFTSVASLSLVAILSATAVPSLHAQVSAGGGIAPIPAAQVATFFEKFAGVAIPSEGTANVTNSGKAGIFAAYNPSTGKAIALAGIGGAGTFTATSSGRSGPCAAIQGIVVEPKAAGASGSITYYQLNGTSEDPLPTTAAEADALFTTMFGPGSLASGQSLATLKVGPNGKVSAFYWNGTTPLQWTTWYGVPVSTTVNVIKAVALVNGKLAAIFSAGAGSTWGKYEQ